MVKSRLSSQGNKSGGGRDEHAAALRAPYCLYKGSRVTLCVTLLCLITMSMCQLITTALLVIISEWSLIVECLPLPFLSHSDFHFPVLPAASNHGKYMTQTLFLIKASF